MFTSTPLCSELSMCVLIIEAEAKNLLPYDSLAECQNRLGRTVWERCFSPVVATLQQDIENLA